MKTLFPLSFLALISFLSTAFATQSLYVVQTPLLYPTDLRQLDQCLSSVIDRVGNLREDHRSFAVFLGLNRQTFDPNVKSPRNQRMIRNMQAGIQTYIDSKAETDPQIPIYLCSEPIEAKDSSHEFYGPKRENLTVDQLHIAPMGDRKLDLSVFICSYLVYAEPPPPDPNSQTPEKKSRLRQQAQSQTNTPSSGKVNYVLLRNLLHDKVMVYLQLFQLYPTLGSPTSDPSDYSRVKALYFDNDAILKKSTLTYLENHWDQRKGQWIVPVITTGFYSLCDINQESTQEHEGSTPQPTLRRRHSADNINVPLFITEQLSKIDQKLKKSLASQIFEYNQGKKTRGSEILYPVEVVTFVTLYEACSDKNSKGNPSKICFDLMEATGSVREIWGDSNRFTRNEGPNLRNNIRKAFDQRNFKPVWNQGICYFRDSKSKSRLLVQLIEFPMDFIYDTQAPDRFLQVAQDKLVHVVASDCKLNPAKAHAFTREETLLFLETLQKNSDNRYVKAFQNTVTSFPQGIFQPAFLCHPMIRYNEDLQDQLEKTIDDHKSNLQCSELDLSDLIQALRVELDTDPRDSLISELSEPEAEDEAAQAQDPEDNFEETQEGIAPAAEPETVVRPSEEIQPEFETRQPPRRAFSYCDAARKAINQ